jgi:deoxyadenosine/deoxycytidine kinase
VSFLLQHYHQIKRRVFEGKLQELVVCDFSFTLDRAYSEVSLDARKRRAFEAVYEEVLADIGPPRMVVQLKCSPDAQTDRIRARGRHQESAITSHFLSSLNTQIEREMNNLSKSVASISVDSHTTNFAEDVDVGERCRRDVLSTISARSRDAVP